MTSSLKPWRLLLSLAACASEIAATCAPETGSQHCSSQADSLSDEVQLLQTVQQLNVKSHEAHPKPHDHVDGEASLGEMPKPLAMKSSLSAKTANHAAEILSVPACPAKMAIPSFRDKARPRVSGGWGLLELSGPDNKTEKLGAHAQSQASAIKEGDEVVEGKLSNTCELPWMAFVYADRNTSEKKQDACSASMITRQHFITAAHCFYLGEPGKPYDWGSIINGSFVNVGVAQNAAQQKVGNTYLVESVSLPFADNWYDGKDVGLSQGDIAIVKLREPVPEKACVSPICIPQKDYIAPGMGWHVAGYGAPHHGLHHGDFEITNSEPLGGVPLSQLDMFSAVGRKWLVPRAGDVRPVVEPGDSGGPFMVRDGEQILLAGTVMGYAISLFPKISFEVVYTNVFKYAKWIHEAVEDPTKSPGGSHSKAALAGKLKRLQNRQDQGQLKRLQKLTKAAAEAEVQPKTNFEADPTAAPGKAKTGYQALVKKGGYTEKEFILSIILIILLGTGVTAFLVYNSAYATTAEAPSADAA